MTKEQEQLKVRLLARDKFTAIPLTRLYELRDNIRASHGWTARETPAERDAIVREWNRMPGNYSFSSAVNQLIFELEKENETPSSTACESYPNDCAWC